MHSTAVWHLQVDDYFVIYSRSCQKVLYRQITVLFVSVPSKEMNI